MKDNSQQLRIIEALLFSSKTPVSEKLIMEHMPEVDELGALLVRLSEEYSERGVNLVNVAGGWTFQTAPDLAPVLRHEIEVDRKLSRAAMETLAIVAYHQPVTRLEIEQIRGVTVSKGTLDILFEANWVAPKGRRRTPGRPVTWVTTDGFLTHFGLSVVDDLPGLDELRAAGLLDVATPPLFIAERVEDGDDDGRDEEQPELVLGDDEG